MQITKRRQKETSGKTSFELMVPLVLGILLNSIFCLSTNASGVVSSRDSMKGSLALAKAVINGTKEGSDINGEIILTETEAGLTIRAEITRVPGPGKHGFHIHAAGSCENGGKAAGGHFNPDGVQHGFLPRNGFETAHAGDMGNIEVDEDGNGRLTIFLPGVRLTGGRYNVVNKAIILHAKEDDFGQPTGNAGARIGCGIIQAVALSKR